MREHISQHNLEPSPTVPIETYNSTVQYHPIELFEVHLSHGTISLQDYKKEHALQSIVTERQPFTDSSHSMRSARNIKD
jgi:hypothetical protein